jgi:hypothetical protein
VVVLASQEWTTLLAVPHMVVYGTRSRWRGMEWNGMTKILMGMTLIRLNSVWDVRVAILDGERRMARL